MSPEEHRADAAPAPLGPPGAPPMAGAVAEPGPAPPAAVDPLAPTPLAEIPELVARAQNAQRTWEEMSVTARVAALKPLPRRVLSRADEIAELLRAEIGKPVEEALLADVVPLADLVEFWSLSIEELLEGKGVELEGFGRSGKLGRVRRAPRGVVALLTPASDPFALPLRLVLPALLCGNAVILKPSEDAPRAAAQLASLLAGLLPPSLFTVVQGGEDAGAALVTAGVDLVQFAGSSASGRRVAVACAERLVPCELQLRGRDAAIVLADAHLERAARGLVWGALHHAGQSRTAIGRVYVERAIAPALLARVAELTRALRPDEDVGRPLSPARHAAVRRQLEEALAAGAQVLAGGLPDDPAAPIPPTVLELRGDGGSLLREPGGGPILPIVVVDAPGEAIERANEGPHGLTASLWTRRVSRANELARRLRAGVVTINNHGLTAALPSAPFPAVGTSGSGVMNSAHAVERLTHPRFVLEDRTGRSSELGWFPYTPTLRRLALALAAARGGRGPFGRVAAWLRVLLLVPRRWRER